MNTGIRQRNVEAKRRRRSLITKQNVTIVRIGQSPCRKNREPVKIRTKPLTGARTKSEIRNVSESAVVVTNSSVTSQSGSRKKRLRKPSIEYGTAKNSEMPARMLELTVNMQNVPSPM